MKRSTILTVLAFLPMAFSPLSAQTIDQSQETVAGGFSWTYYWTGQTFKTSASNVSGVGVNVWNYFGLSMTTLDFQLWSGVSSSPTSQLLRSATVTANFANSGNSWVEAFWSPASVTPGTELFFQVIRPGGLDAFSSNVIVNYGQNVYADGVASYNFSTNPEGMSGCCGSNYDLAFRTYTDGPSDTVTPEPVTMILLGSGLSGIAAARRRRKKNASA